jgi:SSS family solute:Na+ symporter
VAAWEPTITWAVVVAIAAVAAVYTVIGGLRSVAITDALQSLIMLAASLLLFCVVYMQVGGWHGVETALRARSTAEAHRVLHVGSDKVETRAVGGLREDQIGALAKLAGDYDPESKTITTTTPGWLVSLYFVIAGMTYSIANHTQAMRMLGARSEWDLKMSVVVAGTIMIVVTGLNLSMGIMGRVLYEFTGSEVDHVFPNIVRDYTQVGLRGLVLAGIIAASFSTYDSIGSTISALLTRDVYARLLVRDRDDAHYLKVGRWLTPMIIFGSFIYVPFLLSEGMILFYLKIVGTFVVPLLTIYLMGALTRVHRKSAIYGIFAGVGYGVLFLISEPIAEASGVAVLVPPLSNAYAVSPISMLVTAGAMVLASLVFGWESTRELRDTDRIGWLATSRAQIRHLVRPDTTGTLTPTLLGLAVVVSGIVLSFVVFW